MQRKSLPAIRFTRVAGRALWQALGFANERAFQRARKANAIQVPLYPASEQSRGVYARSDELVAYLASGKPCPAPRRSSPMKT
jgi:hypothetical protein